jgi:hypothetical protein
MLVNLTPHNINIVHGFETLTIPSTGLARCEETVEIIGFVDDFIPVVKKSYGKVTGLPEAKEGIWLIVSLLVAQAAGRDDVLAIGDIVRDGEGRIVGCRSLARV